MEEGQIRVWWCPQMPMDNFYVPVANIEQAALIMDTLADYDLFQYNNNVKPDYSNAGGVEIFEDGEWMDWHNDEFDDFDEYKESLESEDGN